MRQERSLKQSQVQRIAFTAQMHKALHILQLPAQELSLLLEQELQDNPLLEIGEEEERWEKEELLSHMKEVTALPSSSGKREESDVAAIVENTYREARSLFHCLLEQAREHFSDHRSMHLAQALIGEIDGDGFLRTPLAEIAALEGVSQEELLSVLEIIQTFHPSGVAAKNLQESLLLQLRRLGKEKSLVFRAVAHHFALISQNKLKEAAQKLHCSTSSLGKIVREEMGALDFRPGRSFPSGHYEESCPALVADITIRKVEGKLLIEMSDKNLPSLRFNRDYLKMLSQDSTSPETRAYLLEKVRSGKWLFKNLFERQNTLYRIAEKLIEKQGDFFLHPHYHLIPLKMKEIADELSLHESTIARAAASKYISSPRGILSLRSFFSHGYLREGEEVSARSVKEWLSTLIKKENPHHPLSDEALSHLLLEQGITCARRTVAKYRDELGMPGQSKRKKVE